MRNTCKLIKNWLPVFVWAGLIFFLSAQPDLKLEAAGGFDFFLRKIAHMTEFAVLFLLLARAFLKCNLSIKKALIFAFAISVLYAFFDEYHQSFVLGRVASLIDIGIDNLGILIAIVLTFLHKRNKLHWRKEG